MPSPVISKAFVARKAEILAKLLVPVEEYDDRSSKGSIDVDILDLLGEINAQPGFVTLSSCSGRIQITVENTMKDYEQFGRADVSRALWTSHNAEGLGLPLEDDHSNKNIKPQVDPATVYAAYQLESDYKPARSLRAGSLIRFKFEPMIMQILTASEAHAQVAICAAIEAGFKESGAVNLMARPSNNNTGSDDAPVTPMVTIRSSGRRAEVVIGIEDVQGIRRPLVDWRYLQRLAQISKNNFLVNERHTKCFLQKFQEGMLRLDAPERDNREDKDDRRKRKRQEGLATQARLAREAGGRA